MIDDKLLIGFILGVLPSVAAIIDRILTRRESKESVFLTALQTELQNHRLENERLRKALNESEARESQWRKNWHDAYTAGRLAVAQHAAPGDTQA